MRAPGPVALPLLDVIDEREGGRSGGLGVRSGPTSVPPASRELVPAAPEDSESADDCVLESRNKRMPPRDILFFLFVVAGGSASGRAGVLAELMRFTVGPLA